jgi:hypothetical protein
MMWTLKTMGTALLLLLWISCSFDSVALGGLIDHDGSKSAGECYFTSAKPKAPVAHFEQFRVKDLLSVRKSSSLQFLCGARSGGMVLAVPAFAESYLYSSNSALRENWQFLLRAAALPRAPSSLMLVS